VGDAFSPRFRASHRTLFHGSGPLGFNRYRKERVVELGNMIFGNSRGSFPVDRSMQDEWYSYMEQMGFDGYGYHDKSDERGIFDNEVFRIQPYYWGDCECDFDAKEDAWSKANSHSADCYQTERRGRLRVWEIDNGYDAVKRSAYGEDADPLFGGFDVTTGQPQAGIVVSTMVPRSDDAMKALRTLDEKRRKVEDHIMDDLCARHKLDRRFGCAVHCTCDFEQRWASFLEANSHASDCRTITPNFTHKPSGFELQWYKYPLRDSYSNVRLTRKLMRALFAECIASVSDTQPKAGDVQQAPLMSGAVPHEDEADAQQGPPNA
jgi:hypothetical protein